MTHANTLALTPATCLPVDAERATLVGRLWQPGVGPVLVAVHDGALHDLSATAPTCSQLLELDDPAQAVQAALRDGRAPRVAALDAALRNSDEAERDDAQPWLL